MSALTSLLVRDGVVPVRKIEEALQRQVISGGDVETLLLEMDALPENVLASYRAALYDRLPASREEIMSVSPEVIDLVPAEVAIEHRLIPLRVQGSVLEVAVREPLSAEQEERLGFLLGFDLVARIACEVRIAAGLAHHYGADLPPRFVRLVDRLRKRDSGVATRVSARPGGVLAAHASDIPYKREEHFERRTRPIAPLAEAGQRPRRTTHRGLGEVAADAEPARAPEERLAPPRQPIASLPDEDDDELDSGPVVFPSSSDPASRGPRAVSQAPPSAAPSEAPAPRRARRPSSSSSLKLLRGPLTLAACERMLKRASDRDEVLEILFSYARQFFDYTALFVVHDDVADGREAWGVGASTEEVQSVSIPLDRPSVFAEARRTIAPLVRPLSSSDVDREIAAALRRPGMPTALVMPIAIRQRVVILLYGDRDGEPFDLGAVMELVRFSSRVVEAFELLILRKKRAGYAGGASEQRGELKEAAKAVAAAAGGARLGASDRRRHGGAWRGGRRGLGSDLEGDSWSSVAPDPPPGAIVSPRPREASEANETVVMAPVGGQAAPTEPPPKGPGRRPPMPIDGTPQVVLGIPRDAPPPPPTAELDLGAPEIAEALAEPAEEKAEPAEENEADEEPEMIVDVDEDEDEDLEAIAELEAQLERERERERAAARARADGVYRLRDGPVDVVPPKRTWSRPRARPPRDPRQDDDEHGATRPAARRMPRRPPSRPTLDADQRSVIVDMGEQVHAQVADLIAAPTEERRAQLLRGLLFLGEAALPALVQAFPGPLAWDRRAPKGPMPAGRDISVVARAIVSFGERAVPYVASLMSSGDADVRFYALLLGGELPHADLIDAVAERIHDEDAGVRRTACALLPRLSGYRGFEEVRVVLRRTARLRGKNPSRRWQAIDAIAALRDVEMIDKLIDLLDEQDDEELIEHVHRALVILTCADHGRSRRRWRAWHEKYGGRHRIEWLIEGLVHGDEAIRALAGAELERLTDQRYGYHAGAPRRERERVHRRYRRWWEEEGRHRYA